MSTSTNAGWNAGSHAGSSARRVDVEVPASGACMLRTIIFVCQGPSCSERGGPQLLASLRERLASMPERNELAACETSCLDHCATGPNVLIGDASRVQTGVLPSAAQALLDLLAGPPRAEV